MNARARANEDAAFGQVALLRMLESALVDAEAARRVLESALRASGSSDVPERPDALVAFCRSHLAPLLAEEIGPRTASTMIDDFAAELDRLRRSDVHTVPPVVRAPLPTIQSPPPTESLPARRPLVGVVERDRFTRSIVAKAFLHAGFDVLPLDAPEEVASACDDDMSRLDVLIIDIEGPLCVAAIRAAASKRPELSVLAWTTAAPSRVFGLLSALGPMKHIVLPRRAEVSELVEAARRLRK